MLIWVGVAAFAVAFGLSAVATPFTRRLATRVGMIDMPARHKAHPRPVPLLGGCAIFAAILLPSMLALAIIRYWAWAPASIPAWIPEAVKVHFSGAAAMAMQALVILGGAFVLHVVGIIDDRRNLGPLIKLIVQAGVATGVVLLCHKVRILTILGGPASAIITVVWLVAITNAFNFLDNMDGLSAGVATICTAALLGASAGIGQVFVSAWLCLMLGALAGFLPYNYNPASTFMGDAGSLVIGFLLGVLSCMTTYVGPGEVHRLYSVFVPVVLMAIPIYDMISVIALRLRDRRNPMVGDRRHFSHRLMRRGMNVRTAVLTIYLCTGGTAIAASLLPRVDDLGAILIFVQTVAILLIVAVLESGEPKS